MKIEQKGNYSGDIIQATLSNRSINNIELFLEPNKSIESNPLEFTNSNEGRKLLYYHLAEGNTIVILVDADADGFTSASIMYQYLTELNTKADIQYIVHENKAHGLTEKVMKEIYEIEPNLVITPDAGSNDIIQIEELESKDINVLVIDHHVVTQFTDKGVVINNQLCPITNHNLVGAGVVYKFLQGIDEDYGFDNVEKYLDLVAIGQIGDSSDISDPEIRNLVLKGLDNINNKFLKAAIGNELGFVKLSPKDMSFGVIPMINAVARVGTLEEREILFEALSGIGNNRIFNVEKKKKNQNTGKFEKIMFNYDIFQYGYDICTKVKARQAAVVKKIVPIIEKSIVDNGGVIIGFTGDNENPGITGLIANKLVSKYDKPALLLNEQENTLTGSGRGHEKTFSDFRKWCEDSGLVEFAQGHDNAFGICIKKDNIEAFKEYARSVEKKEVLYEVDVITNKPSKEDCEVVDNNKRLFGGNVSEPFIGIVELMVPKRFISARGSVLTIYSWGVSCVQFNSNPELYEELQSYPEDNIKINLVGYYSMNNWSGRKTPQLIIKDLEIVYNNNDEEITEDNIIF